MGVVEEAADLIFEFGIGGGDGEESDVEVALGAELAATESAGGDDGELKGVSDFGLKVVAETDNGFVEDGSVTLAPGFSGGLAPEGFHESGSLDTEIVKEVWHRRGARILLTEWAIGGGSLRERDGDGDDAKGKAQECSSGSGAAEEIGEGVIGSRADMGGPYNGGGERGGEEEEAERKRGRGAEAEEVEGREAASTDEKPGGGAKESSDDESIQDGVGRDRRILGAVLRRKESGHAGESAAEGTEDG